ncbi:TolC family protein [Candidatus Ruminimicrobium bovinum]|uniref:TolC family protein n=1 Tax=Candidatus Ruminimicrobium bovinum TaxID=3242779 RepID=UPI0039B952F3
MKKVVCLLITLLFTVNIFAASAAGYGKNDLNVKLFKELEQQEGTKITIRDAVKIALKDSYQVYSATKSKEIAEEALRQANSSYYPYIDFEANYNRALLRAKSLNSSDKMVETSIVNNTYTAQLKANWVLWTGGKITNTKEYIKLQAESSNYKLQHVKSVVARTVVNYCYKIIYASALVHVQETYLDVAKQHLAETKARYKQGLSSNLDILTQQVRVDNIVPQVLLAKRDVELATLSLRQILNKDPESPLFLTWVENDLLLPDLPDLQTLYDMAYQKRPELIVSKLAMDIAEANWKIAKADHYPNLSAYGNYGYFGYTKEGLPDGNHYYLGANVGLNLSLPIFRGFSISSQVKQKELYYEDAKESYENQKKNVRIEVKTAWLNLEEAKKRIESTKGVVAQAQENLNSKMLRYRNGLISQLELNDAISDLNTSELSFVQAIHDAHMALSELNFSVGRETKDYE